MAFLSVTLCVSLVMISDLKVPSDQKYSAMDQNETTQENSRSGSGPRNSRFTYLRKTAKKVYSMRRSRQIIYHDNCCLSTCHLIYCGVESNGMSSLHLLWSGVLHIIIHKLQIGVE
jgi:hypothetical protein